MKSKKNVPAFWSRFVLRFLANKPFCADCQCLGRLRVSDYVSNSVLTRWIDFEGSAVPLFIALLQSRSFIPRIINLRCSEQTTIVDYCFGKYGSTERVHRRAASSLPRRV